MADSNLLPLKSGFTIYQSPYCPHCRRALTCLQNLEKNYNIPYRNINLESIHGNLQTVLDFFKNHSRQYQFNPQYHTRPLIFFNGKFIGGARELDNILQPNI